MNEFPYFTINEVAAQLGVTSATIYRWIRKGLIKPSFKKGNRFFFVQSDIDNRILPNPVGPNAGIKEVTLARIQRDQEFIAAYKAGKTLEQIGIQHGVTRERVRQRLKANGIVRKDGGNYQRGIANSVRRAEANQKRKENRVKKIYGCTGLEFDAARFTVDSWSSIKLIKHYRSYRDRARRERIPWSISFPEFVALMEDHILDIGRGKSVLLRSDSNKGFEIGNLAVVTHSECSKLSRRRQEIIDLYDQGIGPTEIGKKFNIARATVASIIDQIKNIRKFNSGVEP